MSIKLIQSQVYPFSIRQLKEILLQMASKAQEAQ
jgi:hypothetical protein